MWARLNNTNNNSLVIDRLCDQIGAGNMAVACGCNFRARSRQSATRLLGLLLEQIINTSEPILDEVQKAIRNSKGGLVVVHSCFLISSSSLGLRYAYGGYLSA